MKMAIVVGSTAIVSLSVGGMAGYLFAKRRLQTMYADLSDKEITEAKEFYAKLYKKERFATPEEVAENALATEAIAAMRSYQGAVVNIKPEKQAPAIKNIFEGVETDADVASDERNRTEEAPYVISNTEYLEDLEKFTQTTLTYFAGDKVLADDKDEAIKDVDKTVGEYNLQKFGYRSKDPRVVYVRNHALEMEYEILLSDGLYTVEVLGLDPPTNG